MVASVLKKYLVLLVGVCLFSCHSAPSLVTSAKLPNPGIQTITESSSDQDPEEEKTFYCNTALSLKACEDQRDLCQPVFLDHAEEEFESTFAACMPRTNPGPSETFEVKVELVSHEDFGEKDKIEASEISDSLVDADSFSMSDLKAPVPVECKFVEAKYLLSPSKIMLCHQTQQGHRHTLIVSCSTLWTHSEGHDDYLGACL